MRGTLGCVVGLDGIFDCYVDVDGVRVAAMRQGGSRGRIDAGDVDVLGEGTVGEVVPID